MADPAFNVKSKISNFSFGFGELAVLAAEEEINEQTENQPDDEPQPGDNGQPGHQSATKHNRNQREPWHDRDAKRARAIRLSATKENHPQRHQHESEKGPDI